MNLAFFGNDICGRRCRGVVSTFVDIIVTHYGTSVTLVAQGQAGGVSEQEILAWIRATPNMDMALVFHADHTEGALTPAQYVKAQEDTDTVLRHRRIPTVHFVDPEQTNTALSWGLVDQEIMNYLKLTPTYRVVADRDSSDNGIDYYGNVKAAHIITAYIDQIRRP